MTNKRKNFILSELIVILITFSSILITANGFSQGAAINTTNNAAHPSAVLDISSDSKGILIPSMTEIQKNSIT